MNVFLLSHLSAILIVVILGAFVFRTHPQRRTNQLFLLLAWNTTVWLSSLVVAFSAPTPQVGAWAIRVCHAVGVFVFPNFNWLRLSIVTPDIRWRQLLLRDPWWLAATVGVALSAFTPWLVRDVLLPARLGPLWGETYSIPEPLFGPAFYVFGVYFVVSLGWLVWRFAVSLRGAQGIARTELQFMLLGATVGLLISILLLILLPTLTGSAQSAVLAPVGALAFEGILAYGISTRRMMDVAYLFRFVTAYVLLLVYLATIYLATWWSLQWCGHWFGLSLHWPHLGAAFLVIFALAPVSGPFQRLTNRLFTSVAPVKVGTVVKQASRLLQRIGTVDEVVEDFAQLVMKAMGCEQVVVLLPEGPAQDYEQRFPRGAGPQPLCLPRAAELPSVLAGDGEVLVPDLARRVAGQPRLQEACHRLDALQMRAAVGMRSIRGLDGIILLGPRLSGRIYGSPEQQCLQLLADQLAIALHNAALYTQVQDAKIYNDILVDNLASGVIAADADGRVTIFNREAQRITRLAAGQVLKQSLDLLPPILAAFLHRTLRADHGMRDCESALAWAGEEPTPIRVSSSVFHGHAGRLLGAFLVIHDLTRLKHLEQQIRRTDRLASVGTLAAGMAHEIKNPLVSIKTFTQLLPERYEDPDFRETFFSLIGEEVMRIDSIVNQLLGFSRPSKPLLRPTLLHPILAGALKLLHQQMRQKRIHLLHTFGAASDRVNADGDQLNQAFVNFFLNAIEAIGEGGTLTVRTAPALTGPGSADEPPAAAIAVMIEDTGSGIAAENLSHIFDPFFTTKSHGTGLGLSVAHGIIYEHGGVIDVKSELGHGTVFTIRLPLLAEEGAG